MFDWYFHGECPTKSVHQNFVTGSSSWKKCSFSITICLCSWVISVFHRVFIWNLESKKCWLHGMSTLYLCKWLQRVLLPYGATGVSGSRADTIQTRVRIRNANARVEYADWPAHYWHSNTQCGLRRARATKDFTSVFHSDVSFMSDHVPCYFSDYVWISDKTLFQRIF